MAGINIKPSSAKSALVLLDALDKSVRSLSGDVDSVRSSLSFKVSGSDRISSRLREVSGQLVTEADRVRALRTGLSQVISSYETTERANRDKLSKGGSSLWDILSHIASVLGSSSGSAGADTNGFQPFKWGEEFYKSEGVTDADLLRFLFGSGVGLVTRSPFVGALSGLLVGHQYSFTAETGTGVDVDLKQVYKNFKESSGKKADKDKSSWKKDLYKNQYYIVDGKKVKVDPEDDDAVKEFEKHNKGIPVDVKLASVGCAGSLAVFSGHGELSGSVGSISGDVAVSKLDGTAEAYAGPGRVGAEVGASYTAFSASEKGYLNLGSEENRAYEEVKVDVGRVGAKAEGSAGFLDKDGKLNPSLYASASAEAIAGEISAEGGVETKYVDVGVKGSLNYGVGAHANVGLHDGKLSVDIGATLGVGGSVSLEVDLSKTVNAVADGAKNVWSGLKSGAKKLFHW